MFRRIAFLAAVVLAGVPGCAPPPADEVPDEPVLRGVRWGMTPQVVKETETTALKSETEDRLQYNARVFDERSGLTYFFTAGKLTHAWYSFFIRYSEEIPTFDRLKTALTDEYGPPVRDEQTWSPSVPDAERLGKALESNRRGFKDVTWKPWSDRIESGDLALAAEWEAPATVITMRLYGSNGVLRFRLIYRDRRMPPLPEARERR